MGFWSPPPERRGLPGLCGKAGVARGAGELGVEPSRILVLGRVAFGRATLAGDEPVEPGLGTQVAEERQTQGEPVLLQVVHVGRLEELVEQAVASLGQPVHVLLAGGERGDLDVEGPVAGQSLQAWVERPVADSPEGAELDRELFLQLVAGHRRLLEQPQHGELEHEARPLYLWFTTAYRADVSTRCIATIGTRPRVCQLAWPSRYLTGCRATLAPTCASSTTPWPSGRSSPSYVVGAWPAPTSATPTRSCCAPPATSASGPWCPARSAPRSPWSTSPTCSATRCTSAPAASGRATAWPICTARWTRSPATWSRSAPPAAGTTSPSATCSAAATSARGAARYRCRASIAWGGRRRRRRASRVLGRPSSSARIGFPPTGAVKSGT